MNTFSKDTSLAPGLHNPCLRFNIIKQHRQEKYEDALDFLMKGLSKHTEYISNRAAKVSELRNKRKGKGK